MLKQFFFGKSDVGLIRSNNEDTFLTKPELGLCVIADGMGGAAAGELASKFLADAALEAFAEHNNTAAPNDPLSPLKRSFELANRRILEHVREVPKHQGMGCTAEVLFFPDDRYALGHVGDSRTYLLRNGELRQLTQDHSFVQDLVNRGLITPDQARVHPMRHVILRAVGSNDSLIVDFLVGELFPGDTFLLCSDGLTDMVDDAGIEQILSLNMRLADKANKLIEAALAAGGRDNVTVVICEIGRDRELDEQTTATLRISV